MGEVFGWGNGRGRVAEWGGEPLGLDWGGDGGRMPSMAAGQRGGGGGGGVGGERDSCCGEPPTRSFAGPAEHVGMRTCVGWVGARCTGVRGEGAKRGQHVPGGWGGAGA